MTTDQFLIKAYQQHLLLLAKDQVSDEELEYISTLYSDEDDYFDAQECLMFAEDEPSLSNLTRNNTLLNLICRIRTHVDMTGEYYDAMTTIKQHQPDNQFVGYWWVVFSMFWLVKNNTPKIKMDELLKEFLESNAYLKEIEDFI